MDWTAIMSSGAVRGALTGLAAAAVVDFHAFMTWHSVSEVVEYSWSTAIFRWVQGIVSGAIVGAGYGTLIG